MIENYDGRPVRVLLFGGNFAAVDDSELFGFSASGPGCQRTLAQSLLRAGCNGLRQLVFYRAGQCVGRGKIADIAKDN